MTENAIKISAVVPAFNEEGNVAGLFNEIKKEFERICIYGEDYEIIFVDDGSTDNTLDVLKHLKGATVIEFDGNYGQTAALDAGFHKARGRYVVSLDADGQNDPADIGRMLEILERERLDVICGVRKKRQDTFLKRFLSQGARILRRVIMHDAVRDSGCTLRVYRREVLEGFNIYGDQHRFIPALLGMRGAVIGDTGVNHRARNSGKSKYSFSRVFRGLADMFSIRFFRKNPTRPHYTFAVRGFVSFAASIVFAGWDLFRYLNDDRLSVSLTVLAAAFFIIGLMYMGLSYVSELLVRAVYEPDGKRPYIIRKITEASDEDSCS